MRPAITRIRRVKQDPPLNPDDGVLCVVQNGTSEPFSLVARSRTPGRSSFLHEAEADLQVGGHAALVGAVADGVVLSTTCGDLTLAVVDNRPALTPAYGLTQDCERSEGGKMPKWVLRCTVWSASPRGFAAPGAQSIPEVLEAPYDWCRRAWEEADPDLPELTLFAVRDSCAFANSTLWELCCPQAVFVTGTGDCEIKMSDDSTAHVRATSDELVLRTSRGDTHFFSRIPQRVDSRWHLVYLGLTKASVRTSVDQGVASD